MIDIKMADITNSNKLHWGIYGIYILFIAVSYASFAVDLTISNGVGNIIGSVIFVLLFYLSTVWILRLKKRSLWFLLSGLIIFPPVLPTLAIILKNKA